MNTLGMLIPDKTSFINMNVVPLEEDLLSLEINDSFYNSMTLEDLEFQSQAFDVIQRLEKVYGTIKYKFAKGNNSCFILNKILKEHFSNGLIKCRPDESGLRADTPMYLGYEDIKVGEIEGLLLLDRSVDLVTPFALQQTYEGLIDEFIGIQAASIDIER